MLLLAKGVVLLLGCSSLIGWLLLGLLHWNHHAVAAPTCGFAFIHGNTRRGTGVTLRFASVNDHEEADQHSKKMSLKSPQADPSSPVGSPSSPPAMAVGGGWWHRLAELQDFRNRFGHTQVPKRYADNPSLGNFVNKQRQLYRQYQQGKPSSLTPERIALLNAMGFCWQAATSGPSQKEDDATNHVEATTTDPMKQHSEKIASGLSATSSIASTNDRKSKTPRKRIDSTLSQQQYEEKWWKRFDELKAYLRSNNVTDLATISSSSSLGVWLNAQRTEYWNRAPAPNKDDTQKDTKTDQITGSGPSPSSSSSSSSRLTNDMIQALESFNFDWNHRRQQIWDLRLRQLQEYQQEHGDTCVPITYAANPALAQWISRQRKNYNAKRRGHVNALTQERMEQLNAMGFVWNRWDYEFSKKTH